jgi:LacI family transcriptional regulator
LAIGALSALKKHRIKVPQEVRLVGFDNTSITEFISPSITTIDQDKFKMGDTAANILLDMINDHSKKHENIIIPVELIKRETT